jgi:hypothetical protein
MNDLQQLFANFFFSFLYYINNVGQHIVLRLKNKRILFFYIYIYIYQSHALD